MRCPKCGSSRSIDEKEIDTQKGTVIYKCYNCGTMFDVERWR